MIDIYRPIARGILGGEKKYTKMLTLVALLVIFAICSWAIESIRLVCITLTKGCSVCFSLRKAKTGRKLFVVLFLRG
jgi:hypothetical protein